MLSIQEQATTKKQSWAELSLKFQPKSCDQQFMWLPGQPLQLSYPNPGSAHGAFWFYNRSDIINPGSFTSKQVQRYHHVCPLMRLFLWTSVPAPLLKATLDTFFMKKFNSKGYMYPAQNEKEGKKWLTCSYKGHGVIKTGKRGKRRRRAGGKGSWGSLNCRIRGRFPVVTAIYFVHPWMYVILPVQGLIQAARYMYGFGPWWSRIIECNCCGKYDV